MLLARTKATLLVFAVKFGTKNLKIKLLCDNIHAASRRNNKFEWTDDREIRMEWRDRRDVS